MSKVITNNLLSNLEDGFVKDYLTEFLPEIFSFFWCVILALLVYWLGLRIIGHFRRLVKKALQLKGSEKGVIQFTDAIINIAGLIGIVLIVLKLFGVQSASIAAAVASMGVALAMALQGSFGNFAGGILILLLKPFVVGDYIREDTHGNEGTVAVISIFYTKLKQVDGREVIIPNGMLANSSMINMTSAKKRSLDASYGISYGDDIRTAKTIIERIVKEDGRILQDEGVKIFVRELADSAVIIGLRAWTSCDDYWQVVWDTNERVKYAFDEAGITIPFPQVTVSRLEEECS